MSGEIEEQYNNRKRMSIVWRYFEKLSSDLVRCRLCQHEQNYQGTTANIIRHLRTKHNFDATVKEQNNPEMMQLLLQDQLSDNQPKEEDVGEEFISIKDETPAVSRMVNRLQRVAKSKIQSYAEDTDIDPYAATTGQFDEYIGTKGSYNESKEKTDSQSAQKLSAQEERIIAEIEYFREKAAYYRMQKNLTALQAKKVKHELEQMTSTTVSAD